MAYVSLEWKEIGSPQNLFCPQKIIFVVTKKVLVEHNPNSWQLQWVTLINAEEAREGRRGR